MRILLVDDDPAIRAALRRFLTRSGHEIVGEAHDGEEGLRLARALTPEVVIMDLKMPNMTGTEAARLLRKTHPDIAVIMHSAYDERAFQTVAGNAGVSHYIVKGDGPAKLVAVLAELGAQRAIADGDNVTAPANAATP